MRSFIQSKAGTTFYQESTLSLVTRKNYIEYVFILGNGSYGVINLKVQSDQLLFIAKCGSFFEYLPLFLHHLMHTGVEKYPKLVSLLKGENIEYFLGSTTNRPTNNLEDLQILYRKPYPQNEEQPISIAAKDESINSALQLFHFTDEIYNEIKNSTDDSINRLANFFLT